MGQAYWIWHFGDYELYHHMQLSNRREEKGAPVCCMWHVARPNYNARFYRTFTAKTDTVIRVVSHSQGKAYVARGAFPFNTDIPIPAGTHTIQINAFDIAAFPAFFIDSEYLKTDGEWMSDEYACDRFPVGWDTAFTHASDDPRVFPFRYEPLTPVSSEEVDGGILYDYGRELFGPVTLCGLEKVTGSVRLTYGESREEALCYENAIVRETLTAADTPCRPSRAFRYLHIRGAVTPAAEYEYLPLTDRASFSCDDPLASRIWDTCSHTFHLNSREAYFDGIKRDRWVWAGDAYQSAWINPYLYADPAIVRRTILFLLGKPPYGAHINCINDYSCYVIFMVWDYYFSTGDSDFVRRVWPSVRALYEFIVSRTDENGYVVERPGDWIFIDWSEHMDMGGPMCAEQILLWRAHGIMGKLAALCEQPDIYTAHADELRLRILQDYWDDDRGAFIDCHTTGKHNISRHPNIFAVLYDFVDQTTARRIRETVLTNDAIPAITTPYFKLFELLALCRLGDMATVQHFIRSYWGGMIELGATSIWEQYLPNETGAQHYAMYEEPFGRSLCHAWGSGPLLLWGKGCCGVEPTAPGYATFSVRPQPGTYRTFCGTVPVREGEVTVSYDNGTLAVTATVDGGTLYCGAQSYTLPVGTTVTVDLPVEK